MHLFSVLPTAVVDERLVVDLTLIPQDRLTNEQRHNCIKEMERLLEDWRDSKVRATSRVIELAKDIVESGVEFLGGDS